MPPATEASPGPPLAPPTRSVAILFERLPPGLAWGASTAVLGGILAAWPLPVDGGVVARAVAVWFLAVPLCGAVWAPFLGRRDTLVPAARGDPEAAGAPSDAAQEARRGVRRITGRVRGAAARLAAEHWDALFSLALALSIATLLGTVVLLVLAVALGAFALAWLAAGHPPAARGAWRSGLELALPGLLAWLALNGPATLPAPLTAGSGVLGNAEAWWRLNWLFPALLAAFTLIHHAMTAVRRREDLPSRRRQIGLGYIAGVAALALADRPLGTGAVALLWVLQWPFQALFQTGRVRWHLRATGTLAMLAMLAAALAAGAGGSPAP